MGFDHAIGLDSARQQICQRDLGRGDAYAAQMKPDRPEGKALASFFLRHVVFGWTP